ncbi:MAG: HNH endonuclease [Lachnospiraceae bacterium]|nr:HNH endonuclease [Lachnospiraceae bacterium]
MENIKVNFDYCVITMNYEKCNFTRMKKEWRDNKKIMWELPGKTEVPTDKKGNYIMSVPELEEGTTLSKFKLGTVIYFCVTHLPTCDKKQVKTRILLRGIVCEEPRPVKFEDVYFRSPDLKKKDKKERPIIYGFAINDLSTLSAGALKNDLVYNLNKLKKTEPSFKLYLGDNFPNSKNNPLSKDLVDHLEDSFCCDVDKQGFDQLIDHFMQECFFKNHKEFGTKKSHETFTRRSNGCDYYEIHHFIPRAIVNKKDSNGFYIKRDIIEETIIENPVNRIFLCPKCHRKIHHGLKDEVEFMIDKIWEEEEIKNMLMNEKDFLLAIEAENEDDVLAWIKEAYINIYR